MKSMRELIAEELKTRNWPKADLNAPPPKPPEPLPERWRWKPAPNDPQLQAQQEYELKRLAKQPVLKPDGSVLYHCRVCRDIQWLEADVPVDHPLFGKRRLCPCHPDYGEFGASFFGHAFREEKTEYRQKQGAG